MMPAAFQIIACVPMCVYACLSAYLCYILQHEWQYFAFGYGSCIKCNDVMFISSQYKQFKAEIPDWNSANKINLSLLILFVGYKRKKWNSMFAIFFFTCEMHALEDLLGYPLIFLLCPFYLQYIITWQYYVLKPKSEFFHPPVSFWK